VLPVGRTGRVSKKLISLQREVTIAKWAYAPNYSDSMLLRKVGARCFKGQGELIEICNS